MSKRVVTRNGVTYHYWRASVSCGVEPSGKRRRLERQTRSEKAARAWLRDQLARQDRGFPVRGERVTLATYADSWLKDTAGTVKPDTLRFYGTMVDHLDELGHVPLGNLQPQHIRELIAERKEQGYASRTIRGIVMALSLILKRAMGDGLVERNVAALVKLPRLEQKEPAHFTAAQARKFLEVAKDDELGSLYAVALGTGLRRGELLGLTWRDTDLSLRSGAVTVRRSKTSAGLRVVPLPAFAVTALKVLPRGPGPIWDVDPTYVSKHFRVLCDRAGVPSLTFHSLRHSAASLLLDAGVDPFLIRQLIGHSTMTMLGHYSRAGDETKRDAMEKLGRMVG